LHTVASDDPQQAGHGGEATWVELLQNWLPSSYQVVTRRYIVPEQGDDIFETDIVVISPGYPSALREREEIMAGGVAAAFSVKLTLNAAGITDAADRASRLQRGMKGRFGSPRAQMLGAFPVGLLAHGHGWTREGSTPKINISEALETAHRASTHPREILDYTCVANLGTWSVARIPYVPPSSISSDSPDHQRHGAAMTAVFQSDPNNSSSPVAIFVTHLVERMSYSDPTMRSTADGLRLTDTAGSGSGIPRFWSLDPLFDFDVRRHLPARGLSRGDVDWRTVYN
jgi:hypothetical protein